MLKNFLLTPFIFLLSIAIFYLTLSELDPYGEQKEIAFFAFFLSLFTGVSSLFTLVFFFFSEIINREKYGSVTFTKSVWRAMLVGVIAVILCILQIFRLLHLGDLVLMFFFFLVIQSLVLSLCVNEKGKTPLMENDRINKKDN